MKHNRIAFTLAEGATHVATCGNNKKFAFTLAEVLITLGIIGVVAALTIPTLIANHQKEVVGTRLKKFYSSFNQAIQMSVAENGDFSTWHLDTQDNATNEKWVQEYIIKYMQVVETKDFLFGHTKMYYLADGSAFARNNDTNTRDWVYFTQEPKKCIQHNSQPAPSFGAVKEPLGRCAFEFSLSSTKGMTPYTYGWQDDNIETLKQGCKSDVRDKRLWCTKVIQLNDWKIPKDYPWKVY